MISHQPSGLRLFLLGSALCTSIPINAQDRLEQANPQRVEDSRPDLPLPEAPAPPPTAIPVEPAPSALTRPAPVTVLTRVALTGLTELKEVDFAGAIAPFLNRPLGVADLKGLTNALVSHARDEGYVFASARIPPQSVEGGVLTVEMDEGRIDGVRIEGYDDAYLRRILEPLTARPITRARLEHRLLLANEGLGVQVGRSTYEQTDAGRMLKIEVSHDPVIGRASLDNWGSSFVGPTRGRLSVGFGGLTGGADELRASVSFTPLQPREYGYGRLSYARRVGSDGLELSVSGSYGHTRPGASLRARDTAGKSLTGSFTFSQPVIRSRQKSVWAEFGLDLRQSRQEQLGRTVRNDRLTSLTAGLFGLLRTGDALLTGRLTATKGVDLFGATDPGDPDASRSDASGRFTSVVARVSATVPVVPRVEISLSGEGQIASRPLLSSEEFGIGGADIGRGYDYSERLGDEGIGGSVEVRYTLTDNLPIMTRAQIFGFMDGGVTRDIGLRRFDGTLASAGVGAEIELPLKLVARFTAGLPLTGPRDEDGRSTPRLGFAISSRF